MIRALIWAVVFAAGFWAGTRYERVAFEERCINAGGQPDQAGLCREVE